MKKRGVISLFFKMIIREFKAHWSQFIAIIAIGGIAVTLFVGLLANAESFKNQVDAMYEMGNLADIWVTTTEYDKRDLNAIKEIVGEDGYVEPRFDLPSQASSRPIFAIISKTMPTISKASAITETTDDHSDDYFCMVDRTLKSIEGQDILSGFDLGGDFTISVDISSYMKDEYISYIDPYVKDGGENIFRNDRISIPTKLTAFMEHPENIEKSSYNASTVLVSDKMFLEGMDKMLSENFNDEGRELVYGVLYDALTWGSGGLEQTGTFVTPNQYLVKFTNYARSHEIEEQINDYFSAKHRNNVALVANRETMPFFATVNNDAKQAISFTYVFPFVFFFVGILVILTTISQLVVKERTQIGTMKALGLSNLAIYGYYIFLTLFLVGIGTLIGEIVGPVLIPWIMGQKYAIIYTLPARVYTFPILAGTITPVGFGLVSALVTLYMCHKEVKLKPVESMRPIPPKYKAFMKKVGKKEGTFRLSLNMASRNIRKDIVKSLMVIAGVMGCTALLTCGFGIDDTVDYGVTHDMTMVNTWDVSLNFSSSKKAQEIMDDYYAIPGVNRVEPFSQSMSTMYLEDGPQVSSYLYTISKTSDSYFHVEFDVNKCAISEKTARLSGAKVGDMFFFTVGNKTYSAEIALVYEAFVYHGVVIYADSGIIGDPNNISYAGAWIGVEDGVDPATVRDEVTSRYAYIQKAQTSEDWGSYIDGVLSGVTLMTGAVKVFAILLAIVVLYNLALMNFNDRMRDIATLKVLGFTKLEIAMSLLIETMTLTAIGVAIGLTLGYPFLLAVLKTNIVELVEYIFDIKVLSYVISFILTFVVALVVNVWLTSRTGKVKMVESLKSVE